MTHPAVERIREPRPALALLAAVAICGALAAFLEALGRQLGQQPLWSVRALLPGVVPALAVLGLARLVTWRRGQRSGLPIPAGAGALRTLVVDAGLVLVSSFIFGLLAQGRRLAPAVEGGLYDAPLWQLDRSIHGGFEVGVRLGEAVHALGLVPLLDSVAPALPTLGWLALPLLLALPATRTRAARVVPAFALFAVVALALMLWLPVLGPVPYRPTRFFWLAEAPLSQHLEWVRLQDYAALRRDPAVMTTHPDPGLSGFPAIEVGWLVLVLRVALARRGPVLVWVLTLALFGVVSLALGRQYMLGIEVALACALAAEAATGRLLARRPRAAPRPRSRRRPRFAWPRRPERGMVPG